MAPRWMIYLAYRWRIPKLMWALIIIEIPLSIAALALFGIADPDTYRTRLWQNGYDHRFNSNPNEVLYAYANYRPIHTPLIWSKFMTEWNVVISVLSMFVLLVKSSMFVLHGFLPILSAFVHALLLSLYAVAVRNQSSPDLSDKKVANLQKNLPWYLGKGCSFASPKNHNYCMQARASFGVTCVLLALFCVYFLTAVHSCFITAEEKSLRQEDYDEEMELKAWDDAADPYKGLSESQRWTKQRELFMNIPKTPATAGAQSQAPLFTPRTTAFNHLSGRQGEPSAVGRAPTMPSSSGPSNPLPLRLLTSERDIAEPKWI